MSPTDLAAAIRAVKCDTASDESYHLEYWCGFKAGHLTALHAAAALVQEHAPPPDEIERLTHELAGCQATLAIYRLWMDAERGYGEKVASMVRSMELERTVSDKLTVEQSYRLGWHDRGNDVIERIKTLQPDEVEAPPPELREQGASMVEELYSSVQCSVCGYEWPRGANGSHECIDLLRKTIDAHDHAREGLALELGWKMFPYTMPTADGKWCNLWCPPGEMVHISTSRELPTYAELVAALTVERDALRQRVEKAESLLREVREHINAPGESYGYEVVSKIDQHFSEVNPC